MDIRGKLQPARRNLVNAENVLREAAKTYPSLKGPGRAFGRIARAANRPLRIAMLGETNSGKSSLANLLAGSPALPTDPVANTKLPALLKYAPELSLSAVHRSGRRTGIPLCQNIAEATAVLNGNSADGSLPGIGDAEAAGIKYLELGLPSDMLRSAEFMDLPAGHEGIAGLGIDAAIWTTVATQAWRETERAKWMKIPQAVRSRSLLAVTFCDLIAGGEDDRKRLRARLEISAKPYFQDICFITNGDEISSIAALANMALFAQVHDLARDFSAQRAAKAMAIARRVAKNTFDKLEDSAERDATASIARKFAPEAVSGLLGEDLPAASNRPLAEEGLEKPPAIPGPRTPGAATKTPRRKQAPAPHPSAPDQGSKGRSHGVAIGTAFVLGGFAVAGALQMGLWAPRKVAVSDPASNASEAVGQASTEVRRKADAEAAAVEARRKAEAEAAAVEARGKAEAEAAAVEARRKAEPKPPP